MSKFQYHTKNYFDCNGILFTVTIYNGLFKQESWQELDARSPKGISVACNGKGLCSAVYCNRLVMMLMIGKKSIKKKL